MEVPEAKSVSEIALIGEESSAQKGISDWRTEIYEVES